MLFRRRNNQPRRISQLSKPKNKKLRIFLWSFAVIVIALFSWVGAAGLLAFKNISAKNTDDAPSFFKFGGNVSPEDLVKEGDSRINILSIGIDNAAGLTDTIQVVSIDPINKDMAMLSVPRDLYVTAPGLGKTKINSVYNRSRKSCTKKTATCDPQVDYGAEALKDVVESTLGIPIHYFGRVDFEGLKKLVDAVGGIQVYVDRALNDPKFPNRTNTGYEPLYIPAGLQTFNGDKALKYARSRQSTSDFDRSRRQQQVMLALKDKLISTNVLANPKKLANILTILGSHLKTDLTTEDISRLFSIVKDAQNKEITSAVLDNSSEGPLRSSTNGGGQYILVPKKGVDDFSEVKDFVQTVFPEPYLIKEAARVVVVYAPGKVETGQKVTDKLKKYGYNVVATEAGIESQTTSIIYNNTEMPYTVTLLKKRFNATTVNKKPATVAESDVVLTLGTSYTVK